MTKLTQAQRTILSSADDNKFGLAMRPRGLKQAQATKMTTFFVENCLAKEIRAKADSPVWREDTQGRRYALKILKAGRALVDTSEDAGAGGIANRQAPKLFEEQAADNAASMARIAGQKSQLIVGLMQRSDGATIEDITAATGWLPHSARAALSGLRKKGIAIERQPAEPGKASVYRIAAMASRRAA